MNVLKKFGIAIAVILQVSIIALPAVFAQTRTYSNVIQLGNGGAYLGIQMDDVTADNMSKYKLSSERGVIVRSVVKGSPAEAASIKEDDVILEFGVFPVWSSMQLTRLVQETPVGRKVEIVVQRDGKRINLNAKLETREGRSTENRMEILPELPRDWFGQERRPYPFGVPGVPESGPNQRSPGRPRLGISITSLTEQLGEAYAVPNKKGVLVTSVSEGSPSAGKLQAGDVIISADGKDIAAPEELTQAVQNKTEGAMTLKVIRDKKEITVVVTLPVEEGKGYKL